MSISFTPLSRRLPVYILIDCSSSMSGVKIAEAQDIVTMIYQELISEQRPHASYDAYISVIFFADQAEQIDFVPISQFTPPAALQTNGTSALGQALHLLNESLVQDVIIVSGDHWLDHYPLVFLLTNGHPTDHWQSEAKTFMSGHYGGGSLGIGIGEDADMNIIGQLAKRSLLASNLTSRNILQGLGWVFMGRKLGSRAALASTEEPILIPPPGLVFPYEDQHLAQTKTYLAVFISYSRTDSAFADELEGSLHARGYKTWMDRQGLEGGDEWARVIPHKIAECNVMVVVLSPDAVASEWVESEILYARQQKKPIIPIIARPVDMPFTLNTKQPIDFTDDRTQGLQALCAALDRSHARQ